MHTLGSIPELWAARNHIQPLADRAENPFLGIDWLTSAAEAFHPNDQLRVLVLARSGEAAAVAPLVAVQRNGHESLELIGTPALREPAGLLHDSDASLQALIRDLLRLGPTVRFRGLDTAGKTLGALREIARRERLGMLLTHDEDPAMSLAIDGQWPQYLRTRAPAMRRALRRSWRRASALGVVSFETLSPVPDDVPGIMATLTALDNSRWTSGERSAQTQSMRAFHAALAARAAARGTLRVHVMRIGTRMVAMQLSLEMYRRLWPLKIAADKSVASVHPRFLLTHHAIRFAHDRRLASVEFVGRPTRWQMRSQPTARPCASVLAVPLTARGLSGLAIDLASRQMRRWLPSTWGLRTSPLGPRL